jgi:hypothetical protein
MLVVYSQWLTKSSSDFDSLVKAALRKVIWGEGGYAATPNKPGRGVKSNGYARRRA